MRFLWIDRFPVGMAHDEVQYAVNGLSYKFMGEDVSGYGLPLSVFRTETIGRVSIVPTLAIYFLSYVVEINELNLRIFYSIIGVASGLVLYKITELLVNKKAAVCVLIVFFLNPWTFDLFRWIGDTAFALMFYLLGIYFFLGKSKHKYRSSILFFILGYFSYYAARVVFLPLIVILFTYKYILEKQNTLSIKKFLLVGVALFITFLLLEFTLPGSPASGRSGDLVIFNKQYLADHTNQDRREAISTPINNLLLNKYSTAVKNILRSYIAAYSSDMLFIRGDNRATYTFSDHGLFYYIDIFLISSGTIYLVFKKKKTMVLLVAIILISPLPTALNIVETSVFNRSFMMLPIICLISGLGLYSLANIKNKKVIFVIIPVYFLSVVNFLHFYFFRFPILQQENHYLSEKLLSNYIDRNKDKQVVVYNGEHRSMAMNYTFFSITNSKENIKQMASQYMYEDRAFKINNAYFTNNCELQIDGAIIVVHKDSECGKKMLKSPIVIQNQMDSGGIFFIDRDTLCDLMLLTPYRRSSLLSDYYFFEMSDSEFCNRWFNSL